MNVSLTPELEKFVSVTVSTGRYSSACEVVRASLRTFQKEEPWKDDARNKIARGVADIEAGRVVDGDTSLQNLRKRAIDARK